jgi:hypothetical protein
LQVVLVRWRRQRHSASPIPPPKIPNERPGPTHEERPKENCDDDLRVRYSPTVVDQPQRKTSRRGSQDD